METPDRTADATPPARYSRAARVLHWLVAAFVVCLVPLGLYMTARGEATNFDALTGRLYDLHKLLGFTLLWVVVLRILVRLRRGAPPPLATLTPFERIASTGMHHLLYVLLLVVPLLGWAGISAYPALNLFGLFDLPGILTADEPLANRILGLHGLLAQLLAILALLHIAAALRHRFIKKDGVLRRMWPPD
ncbi:cytochrome b/b6 domain-containing protein [Starkeya koreensis]|uniref:Cytochrome b/b6 domain-containing protein n=1 Tax=Ancylobacter koreensis TaxID=266121 RepID=A0ABT0DLJ8_9HYPH|nr:cytochrome b/b6 domain-containing protein [Ancylobacter koreensis]MCK0207977.1 cytochrome b/b6 domain-containing protein [Ancylobacter koreensis]